MAGEYKKAKQLFDTMLSAGHAPAEALARVVSGYRLTVQEASRLEQEFLKKKPGTGGRG
jgi:hypothetical protein